MGAKRPYFQCVSTAWTKSDPETGRSEARQARRAIAGRDDGAQTDRTRGRGAKRQPEGAGRASTEERANEGDERSRGSEGEASGRLGGGFTPCTNLKHLTFLNISCICLCFNGLSAKKWRFYRKFTAVLHTRQGTEK